jgi:predicted transcriptional regulator
MATDLRRLVEAQFFKARSEYIAAIRAHADALAAAIGAETLDLDAEYERAVDLQRKHEAYRQATDDVRAVNSRQPF